VYHFVKRKCRWYRLAYTKYNSAVARPHLSKIDKTEAPSASIISFDRRYLKLNFYFGEDFCSAFSSYFSGQFFPQEEQSLFEYWSLIPSPGACESSADVLCAKKVQPAFRSLVPSSIVNAICPLSFNSNRRFTTLSL